MTCAKKFVPYTWQTVHTPTNPPMAMVGWFTRCACCDGERFTVLRDAEASELGRVVLRVFGWSFVKMPHRWLPRMWIDPCRVCRESASIRDGKCTRCNAVGGSILLEDAFNRAAM